MKCRGQALQLDQKARDFEDSAFAPNDVKCRSTLSIGLVYLYKFSKRTWETTTRMAACPWEILF
jgi:hypothetical protein